MVMTNEEKRIKIAEACGWKCSETTGAWCIPACWEKRHHGSSWVSPSNLPDYFSDLNACHEMEKLIVTGEGWRQRLERYSSKLMSVMHETDFGRIDVAFHGDMVGLRYMTCHATASQRAEAFGKTLNLW